MRVTSASASLRLAHIPAPNSQSPRNFPAQACT
jgi:hypothetical protein